MATQAQDKGCGSLFLAPLTRGFHCTPPCAAHPLGRMGDLVIELLTVGGRVAPQICSEVKRSAGRCLTRTIAQQFTPTFRDITLDTPISQTINAPGWKTGAVLCAAAPARGNDIKSIKPGKKKQVLSSQGNSEGKSRRPR